MVGSTVFVSISRDEGCCDERIVEEEEINGDDNIDKEEDANDDEDGDGDDEDVGGGPMRCTPTFS